MIVKAETCAPLVKQSRMLDMCLEGQSGFGLSNDEEVECNNPGELCQIPLYRRPSQCQARLDHFCASLRVFSISYLISWITELTEKEVHR